MIQIDHIYVFTEPAAPGLITAFENNGFNPGRGRDHPRQGTANQCVFFNNAYFEAIWAVDEDEIKSDAVKNTKLYERSQWQSTGFSPFGIAF